MMYLSYVNDWPEGARHCKDNDYILAAVIDDKLVELTKSINEAWHNIQHLPNLIKLEFIYPSNSVRLLEAEFLHDYLTDKKVYEDWEIGCDDPLEYYRSLIHPYEPKEDFWHAQRADSIFLKCQGYNCFGFDVTLGTKTYKGFSFEWRKIENNHS